MSLRWVETSSKEYGRQKVCAVGDGGCEAIMEEVVKGTRVRAHDRVVELWDQ